MTTTKTIQSVAQEILNNMEEATRNDGSKYIRTIKDIEWQKEIIFKAHQDRLPSDYIYEFIQDALYAIVDAEDNEEAIEEAIYGIEADVYTSDLTRWLHSNNHNVYYLTEALEEFEIKDGFQALAIAQQKQKQEVAIKVLNGIKEYIES